VLVEERFLYEFCYNVCDTGEAGMHSELVLIYHN
jgi:hypothetical protein